MIRVEIGTMPSLLRSIVGSALETQEDFTVMAPLASEGRERSGADVLIVCSDRKPDDCISIRTLTQREAPAIVAIDSDGASATILRIVAESSLMGAASDLGEAVRRAARQRSRTTD